MAAQDKNKVDYRLLGRVFSLTKPYRRIFILAASLAVLLAPISTARPFFIKEMVDKYIFVNDIAGMTRMVFVLGGC